MIKLKFIPFWVALVLDLPLNEMYPQKREYKSQNHNRIIKNRKLPH